VLADALLKEGLPRHELKAEPRSRSLRSVRSGPMADAMGDIVSSDIEDRAVIEHAANANGTGTGCGPSAEDVAGGPIHRRNAEAIIVTLLLHRPLVMLRRLSP
jgi:hypothetical protein